MTKGVAAFIFVVAIFVLAQLPAKSAGAEPVPGGSTTVKVMIRPVRSVVITRAGKITEIYSNTPEAIRPTVYLERESGRQVPYSTDIANQYQKILPTVDLKRTGLIYKYSKGQSVTELITISSRQSLFLPLNIR